MAPSPVNKPISDLINNLSGMVTQIQAAQTALANDQAVLTAAFQSLTGQIVSSLNVSPQMANQLAGLIQVPQVNVVTPSGPASTTSGITDFTALINAIAVLQG